MNHRNLILYVAMAALLLIVGFLQSWQLALTIINLCLISAVMSLGVNLQWGVAGMFNVGTMGSAAVGGLAVVLIATPQLPAAQAAGGMGLLLALIVVVIGSMLMFRVHRRLAGTIYRLPAAVAVAAATILLAQYWFAPAVSAIEAMDAASTGNIGGLGWPVVLSWPVGAVLAGFVGWMVARLTAGLRSDYLAVATFGISEIVIAVLRNEEWLARGVKNVTGLPRPVPYESELQAFDWVNILANWLDQPIRDMASILVKLAYAAWFLAVLVIVFLLLERLRAAPWGRMMRAIRDDEEAANAMGKDVSRRHIQVFVLGSAIIGLGGAMLVTLDGQFTPGSYQSLRYTFLIWLMVIVGGSGNHRGAIFGSFLIWFLWVQAETVGIWLAGNMQSWLPADSMMRDALAQGPAQLRYVVMGLILVLVMRFSPRGLMPEETPKETKEART